MSTKLTVVIRRIFQTHCENDLYITILFFRCFSIDQSQHDGIGPGAKTNDQRFGTFAETVDPGFDTWSKSTLLFHFHKLSEKRT